MYATCLVCGSDKIMADVSLRDEGAYAAPEHRITIARNPNALFNRGAISSQMRAHICGACGYAAMFIESPARMYAAYLHAQERLATQAAEDAKHVQPSRATQGNG